MEKTEQGPWRITFDTNPDTCNLNCIMCEEHSPHRERQREKNGEKKSHRIMPIGLIEKVVAEAVPLGLQEIIPSTMGEPLLYRHFDRIVEICHEYGLTLNLTTNGTFPGKSIEEWAELITPVCSDIKISWNGSSKEIQESIMLKSDLGKMKKKLKRFLDVREKTFVETSHYCNITLQMTFMEANLNDLPDMVNMAIDFGIDRLKGHHLWTHFPEIENLSLRKNSDSIKRWNSMLETIQEIAYNNPLANGKRIILENFSPLNPKKPETLIEDGVCPFLGREAWINAEGRFDPCCAPDAQRKTLGYFGSITETSFSSIWSGTKYRSLIRMYNNHQLCQSCNMKKRSL